MRHKAWWESLVVSKHYHEHLTGREKERERRREEERKRERRGEREKERRKAREKERERMVCVCGGEGVAPKKQPAGSCHP